VSTSDALARWRGTEERCDSAAVECEKQSDGTPCARQLEEKESFDSALQRIEVRVNMGRHESVGAGREPGVEVAVYNLAGTRAKRRGRLHSLAWRTCERQVAFSRVGPRSIPMELGSVLFKWARRRGGSARSTFFFY
jgi:hypothetical protein